MTLDYEGSLSLSLCATLNQWKIYIMSSFLTWSNPIIHQKAINVVRNLLYNHDLDLRYMDTAMKSRLAALYMPIIGIVIEALPQLSDPGLDLRRHTSCPEEEEADKISHSVAMEIAGATVFAGRVQEYPGGMDEPKVIKISIYTMCSHQALLEIITGMSNILHVHVCATVGNAFIKRRSKI